jgi:hypothetical protein
LENNIVYVLSNPAMPGLVKIGKTNSQELKERMKQLYTTGVPFPFDCEYACKVDDCSKVEKAFHNAFGNVRINDKREFFEIEPERVISILELLAIEDISDEISKELIVDVSSAEQQSSEKMKKSRRKTSDFHEMGIEKGSILEFTNGDVQVEVISERKVKYNDEITSLTAVTKKLLGITRPLQPSPYWTYEGRKLKDIYNETYTI